MSCISCTATKDTSVIVFNEEEYQHPRNLNVILFANDLSEDMSILSSGNDEIVLLIYSIMNGDTSLILSADKTIPSRKFAVSLRPRLDTSFFYTPWIVVLLEVDTDRTSIELEPLVTPNLERLTSLHHEQAYNALSQILGDDDLLAIQPLDSSEQWITMKGILRADMYAYKLQRYLH